MSIRSEDSALTGAGYSLVGLGRPESFSARAQIPSATSHVMGAAVLGTKVYVAGGYLSSSSCTANLWEYDLATDKWRSRQQMSVARYGQVIVGARGKVYAIGGYVCNSTSGTQLTEIYDPQLNTWTLGAPLPDHNHHAAAYGILSDGKLHVVGGVDTISGGISSRSHVVYDFDTNRWSTARDLPVARHWSASGVLPDGRLILAGGHDGSSYRAETYLYDPATNSWAQVASMPGILAYHTGAVIAGQLHTFTGWDTAGRNYHYIYDPLSGTWSSGAAVPFTGYAPSVAQLRGGALIIGGWTNSAITSVYEYLAPLYLYSK
ncbi:Kelch repeat-containing protein [Hyalangium minutum]|nr:kelch repeat-containing protein [Hyalangium minutum]